MRRKCDVCGVECEGTVCCSACGATSFYYCDKCFDAGAEPWDTLVAYISCGGVYPDDIHPAYIKIVQNTCDRLGKTEEEFAKDVRKCTEDMDKSYKEWTEHQKK